MCLLVAVEVALSAWDGVSKTDAELMCKIWLPAKALIMIASEVVPIVWMRRLQLLCCLYKLVVRGVVYKIFVVIISPNRLRQTLQESAY